MAKEGAQFCLLDVAEAAGQTSGSDIGLTVAAGVVTIDQTGGQMVTDGAVVGGTVVVRGLANNPDFSGVIKSAAEASVVVIETRDADSGRSVTIVDEPAGAAVTLDWDDYKELAGQDDTTYTIDGGTRDVTTKDGDNWQEFLPGVSGMSVSVAGFLDKGDPEWETLRAAMESGQEERVRLRINGNPDAYYFRGIVTNMGGGGSTTAGNAYNYTVQAMGKPVFVLATALAA